MCWLQTKYINHNNVTCWKRVCWSKHVYNAVIRPSHWSYIVQNKWAGGIHQIHSPGPHTAKNEVSAPARLVMRYGEDEVWEWHFRVSYPFGVSSFWPAFSSGRSCVASHPSFPKTPLQMFFYKHYWQWHTPPTSGPLLVCLLSPNLLKSHRQIFPVLSLVNSICLLTFIDTVVMTATWSFTALNFPNISPIQTDQV